MAVGHRSGMVRLASARVFRISLALFWLAFVMVAPVRADDGTPPDSPPPVEEPTDIPAPEPTDVPPPPPTDVPPPPPTDIPPPPPTDVPPPPPTDVPEIPTEVPPTEVPTEEPTAEPTEEPSPTPTPEPDPAIPFDPVLDCALIDGGSLAVAGETTWSFQDCTVSWQTENVSSVVLQASTGAGGWQVIAVADPADTTGADGALNLTDTNADDDGFLTSRFYVGTQLGCTSATSAQVQLQLTATSTAPVPEDEAGNPIQIENEAGELEQIPPGDPVIETTLDDLAVSGHGATAPLVTLNAVTFQPISNSLDGSRVTTGTVEIVYAAAPATCGWEMVVSFSDFTAGDSAIPASNLVATGVSGLDGVGLTSDGGTISIVSPTRDVAIAESGVITISVALDLGGFVPGGSYGATVVAESIASP